MLNFENLNQLFSLNKSVKNKLHKKDRILNLL